MNPKLSITFWIMLIGVVIILAFRLNSQRTENTQLASQINEINIQLAISIETRVEEKIKSDSLFQYIIENYPQDEKLIAKADSLYRVVSDRPDF